MKAQKKTVDKAMLLAEILYCRIEGRTTAYCTLEQLATLFHISPALMQECQKALAKYYITDEEAYNARMNIVMSWHKKKTTTNSLKSANKL